jgi:toxin ParE1/3/4
LQVKHHAAFYQVHEPEVLIVRVLHEDMDAPRRLLD